jgi:hypothetical protein
MLPDPVRQLLFAQQRSVHAQPPFHQSLNFFVGDDDIVDQGVARTSAQFVTRHEMHGGLDKRLDLQIA